MKRVLLTAAALIGLAGCMTACSPAQQATAVKLASTPAGQLFCAVQTAGGGAVVAGIIGAATTAEAPGALPIVALATGAAKADVDATCASAGGVPVSPPANPAAAPQIAVKLPAGLPTLTVTVASAS